jgi:hypothetical protein
MIFKVVGSRRVAHVAPGGEVTEQQIVAAGGSVSHLVASGHIAPVASFEAAKVSELLEVASDPVVPVVKARKAASTITPVDEADTEENI